MDHPGVSVAHDCTVCDDVVPCRFMPLPVYFQPQLQPPSIMFITSENTYSI